MKLSVEHIGYGKIEYNESFWSGKKRISFDGQELTKKSKNLFVLQSDDGEIECKVKGNAIFGCTLSVGEDTIILSDSCRWYEIFCTALMCVFILVWGNVPYLCEIFPLIGGAFGGAICGLAACANIYMMKKVKKVPLKLLVWLGIFAITVLACYIPGLLLRGLLSVGELK